MNKLKELRLERDLSQEEVGKVIGISGQALGLYENGKRDIPTKNLIKLANFYNVSADYILGKTELRNSIDINEIDLAFSNGINALNDTNKMIIKNTMEALLAKQEEDENKQTKEKNNE